MKIQFIIIVFHKVIFVLKEKNLIYILLELLGFNEHYFAIDSL